MEFAKRFVVKGELITKETAEKLLEKLTPDLIRLNDKEKGVYAIVYVTTLLGFIKNRTPLHL